MFNFLTLSFTNVLSYIIVILCVIESLRCSGDFKAKAVWNFFTGKMCPCQHGPGNRMGESGGAWRPFIESGEAPESGKSLSEASFLCTLWQW